MTRSLYIVGGAGTGKSTFTAQVLEGLTFGPLLDLHSKPNSRGTVITLRGHAIGSGLYLGINREYFPGSDGLDRVSVVPAEEWVRTSPLPEFIISEGSTLSARKFLIALQECTNLLLVLLLASPGETARRVAGRGEAQAPEFVKSTATRAANVAQVMAGRGARVLSIDTESPDALEMGLALCQDWLL